VPESSPGSVEMEHHVHITGYMPGRSAVNFDSLRDDDPYSGIC